LKIGLKSFGRIEEGAQECSTAVKNIKRRREQDSEAPARVLADGANEGYTAGAWD
jgi:hypothetical protein